MKVLLIEDDEGISQIILYILENAGCKVLRAVDEIGILEALDHNHISFVLMDVSLQDGDGGELTKKIKAEKTHAAVPIVLMSAHQDLKTIAQRAGAAAFLKKPFDIEDLLDLLKRFNV
ncbi:MAG: response regulator [Candidatus Levybacteria bacterium]|nr:response regulator [Candidatus Levybacteria bacterium]